jgi:uncharacterized repeat protein (TIGR02543 family)
VTLGAVNAAGVGSLSIGAAGNTSAVTLGGTVTSGGPIAVTGGAITVSAAVTATNSPITFTASTSVTQNSTITASAMNLRGTASYTPSAYTVVGGSALVALYATFDTQGGTAVASSTFASGGPIALPTTPSRAGYTFTGWFAAPTGGSPLAWPYTPASNTDQTIYAQWSVYVPVKVYPIVNQIISGTATEGSTVYVKFAGERLDQPIKVSATNGVASISKQTATLLEIAITGATVGRGTITIENSDRTLQAVDVYRITANKPVVIGPVYKEYSVVFDGGSATLTKSDESAIRASLAGAKVVGGITVAASMVEAKPTAASRSLAVARARAIAAVIAKALPGVSVSTTTIATPGLAWTKGEVSYSFSAKP